MLTQSYVDQLNYAYNIKELCPSYSKIQGALVKQLSSPGRKRTSSPCPKSHQRTRERYLAGASRVSADPTAMTDSRKALDALLGLTNAMAEALAPPQPAEDERCAPFENPAVLRQVLQPLAEVLDADTTSSENPPMADPGCEGPREVQAGLAATRLLK
eukprot:Sspe_Gene.66315::Locus_39183_Transcript_1_1_Confidence_1.000_Length_504::g.66315::m.66315